MSKTNEYYRLQDEDEKMAQTIHIDTFSDRGLLDPVKITASLQCWLKMVEAGEVLERLIDSDYVMDAQEEAPKLNHQKLILFQSAEELMEEVIKQIKGIKVPVGEKE